MAQGTSKLKSKARNVNKGKSRPKQQGMRKGSRYITPKKAQHVQADKLKKGLEKAIKNNIESEITKKVQAIEPRSFKIVKLTDTDPPKNPSSTGKAQQK